MEHFSFGGTLGGDQDISYIRKIAAGAAGEIYDKRSNERFARKIIRQFGDVTADSIQNEARAIAKLCKPGTHRNIVTVFRQGKLEDPLFHYIDMELCQTTLEQYMQQQRQSTEARMATIEDIWHIMMQLTSGVAFIHTQGEVHRDLKPRNILYSQNDSTWKIGDFGFTSEGTSKRLHATTSARGTAGYRAPELIRDKNYGYNNKVDIWSLGCILYELVTRAKAFTSNWNVFEYVHSRKKRHLPADIVVPKAWRQPLSSVIEAMLERDSTKRPSARVLFETFVFYHAHSPGDLGCFPTMGIPSAVGTVQSNGPFMTIELPGLVRAFVSCTESSQFAASIWKSPNIYVFDAQTHSEFRILYILNNVEDVLSLAFAKADSGLSLAAGGSKTIALWDLKNNTLTARVCASSPVHSLAFNCDASRLAAGCENGRIEIWNKAGQMLAFKFALGAHLDTVCELQYDLWNNLCSSSYNDGAIVVWCENDIQHREVLKIDSRLPHGGQFSLYPIPESSERYIVTVSNTGVAVWNLATGLLVENVQTSAKVRNATYTPCGNYILAWSVDDHIWIWNRWNMQLLHTSRKSVPAVGKVRFCTYKNPLFKQFMCAFQSRNVIELWEYEGVTATLGPMSILPLGSQLSPTQTRIESIPSEIYSVVVDGSNKRFATVSGWLQERNKMFSHISLWDATNGMLLWRFEQSQSSYASFPIAPSFSHNGRVMMFYDGRHSVYLFDVERRTVVERISKPYLINLVQLSVDWNRRAICTVTIEEDETVPPRAGIHAVLKKDNDQRSGTRTTSPALLIDHLHISAHPRSNDFNEIVYCVSYTSRGEFLVLVTGHRLQSDAELVITWWSTELREVVCQERRNVRDIEFTRAEILGSPELALDMKGSWILLRIYYKKDTCRSDDSSFETWLLCTNYRTSCTEIPRCVTIANGNVIANVRNGVISTGHFPLLGPNFEDFAAFRVGLGGENFEPCWMVLCQGRLTLLSRDGRVEVADVTDARNWRWKSDCESP